MLNTHPRRVWGVTAPNSKPVTGPFSLRADRLWPGMAEGHPTHDVFANRVRNGHVKVGHPCRGPTIAAVLVVFGDGQKRGRFVARRTTSVRDHTRLPCDFSAVIDATGEQQE